LVETKTPIKSIEEVVNWINGNKSVLMIDCRYKLSEPNNGFDRYKSDHIKGALYIDLEKDLSDKVEKHGGRHPLPSIHSLERTMGRLGINEDTVVVAYDDEGGAFASRLWWVLTYLGHEHVYVLGEGYTKWKSSGYAVDDVIPTYTHTQFKANPQHEMLTTQEEVLTAVQQGNATILDSREVERYLGLVEPIDRIAGRIPGAKHAFWKGNLNEDGTWKSNKELSERFNMIDKKDSVIVYCGSGVTACPNVLALTSLGYKDVKLYAGSWSDWITYEGIPIETNKK
jgi:thiosulfate/3-mercaptopyruvate sulfurtransferase